MYWKSNATDSHESEAGLRDEKVLGWAVDYTARIDRSKTVVEHTTCNAAETAAPGSNGLNRKM
jgi:hypothetical protein